MVDDLTVKLQVWDTAGQERFRNITQAYFKGAKAIILAYDITHADSFQNLNSWTKQIETVTAEKVVKMLVATKCDLEA
jgi:small GTP-binding protein